MLGTFPLLNGNNRLVWKVTLYSVQYSSKQYRGYKLGDTLVGQLWLIVWHVIQFHYSVAYSARVECNNAGIIGNLKELQAHFWKIKE